MEFADSYFEDEVRDGYYIPSIMKKAWAAEQEVLAALQEVCKKNNIDYFAEWGTLLGVIRHGGMIPWDDDLDVCMKSSDFRRFIKLAKELPEGFVISDYHMDDGTGNMVANVSNSKGVLLEPKRVEQFHGFPYVASVDIFSMDFLPPNKDEEEAYGYIVNYLCGVASEVTKERRGEKPNPKLIDECLVDIEKFFHIEFDRDEVEHSLEIQLYDVMIEQLATLYTEQEAKELTHLALWTANHNYRLPKSCFAESLEVPFENMKIRVPIGYEELVQKKYGAGYMNPVRSGGSHNYPYFEKIEKTLRESTSYRVFEYTFSRDELEKVEKEREKERENKEESLQSRTSVFLPLFTEAHENLIALLCEGDLQSVIELMGDCQNVAVELGNLIEEERGEGTKTVGILENYCNTLFETHQEILRCVEEEDQLDVERIHGKLLAFEQELEAGVATELRDKKEIVFVPYKPEQWDSMAAMWKEAMEAEDREVYVIPAPYYYKDCYNEIKLDEMQYETEGYPKEVSLTSYEDYNFQAHHPDTIVIQCPYDDYNYALSIHPFFYVSNMKKYTENLVYIPGLVMDDVGPGDDRMRTMLRYYCNTPGVVHADQVIVQSEQMRQVYIELLTEFAGEDTKEMWEKKITASKESIQDNSAERMVWQRDKLPVPEEWLSILKKPDGTWKKIILYTTSGGAIRMQGEKAIEKMKGVMQTFQESWEDVALIWRPDPNVKNMIRKSNPGLWQKYRDFLQEYKGKGMGVLDDRPRPQLSIALCDACYGDGGSIMNTCRELKKPVMIQNVDC